MSKTAFLFPGQGAQYVGMGRELYEHYPAAREIFDRAAQLLGDEIIDVIFNGPEEVLQKTANTQPAILITSMAAYQVLISAGCYPGAAAGLSLGEYSALTAAGALDLSAALPLVQQRGRYMQEAVPEGKGSMAAILGLAGEKIEQLCQAAQGQGAVAPANYNSPGQVVISGDAEAVNRAVQLAKEAGAKKVVELKVSAPFHCQLMQPVEEKMRVLLAGIEMRKPDIPVVFNVSAAVETNPTQIKASLIKQVSSPILWEQSIRVLLQLGFDTFIEVGPGKSLTKLVKKIAGSKTVAAAAIDGMENLEEIKKLCKGEGSLNVQP